MALWSEKSLKASKLYLSKKPQQELDEKNRDRKTEYISLLVAQEYKVVFRVVADILMAGGQLI